MSPDDRYDVSGLNEAQFEPDFYWMSMRDAVLLVMWLRSESVNVMQFIARRRNVSSVREHE
jgi:hypothetical protein